MVSRTRTAGARLTPFDFNGTCSRRLSAQGRAYSELTISAGSSPRLPNPSRESSKITGRSVANESVRVQRVEYGSDFAFVTPWWLNASSHRPLALGFIEFSTLLYEYA